MMSKLRSVLRFTIRDVLWLTLVVAALLGWWVDRDRLVQQYAERERERKAEARAIGEAYMRQHGGRLDGPALPLDTPDIIVIGRDDP